MISPIKINGKPVFIPSDWGELTFGQFLSIQKSKTDAEILSAVTGIELETCEQLQPDMASALLSPLLLFVNEEVPEVINSPLTVPDRIGKKEYARKINCDAAAKKYTGIELFGKFVSIYCCDGIQDEQISEFEKEVNNHLFINVYHAGKVIIEQLNKLNESEKKIPQPQYRSEEIQAGVNEFKKFGVAGLVRSIALRWGVSKETIYNWSYNEVLIELKISAEESRYQRKLNEILSKPKK